MHKGLRFTEKVGYIAACIATLGFWWQLKVLMKAALLEALKGDWEED